MIAFAAGYRIAMFRSFYPALFYYTSVKRKIRKILLQIINIHYSPSNKPAIGDFLILNKK